MSDADVTPRAYPPRPPLIERLSGSIAMLGGLLLLCVAALVVLSVVGRWLGGTPLGRTFPWLGPINGDFEINGTFDFDGMVIVRDDVRQGTGMARVTGAVMARNVNLGDGGSTWLGNQSVFYSKCAVESALRGSAILVRARDRSWLQVF